MDRLARVAAAATAIFVALVGFAVVTAGRDHPRSHGQLDPTGGLIDAWARTRTMTHRSEGVFERANTGTGQVLRSDVEVVQRDPDRLVRRLGEVNGQRGDRALVCPAPLDGSDLECRLGPRGRSYDEVVAAEVAEFRALFAGDDPLYLAVARPDHCWELSRQRYDPRSGFGVEARLCFTDDGALESVVIDHGEVVETTIYEEITFDVSDADLEP